MLAVTKAVGPAFAAMTGAGRRRDASCSGWRVTAGFPSAPRTSRRAPRRAARRAAHGGGAAPWSSSVWAARRDDGLDVLVSIVDVGALAAFTLLHASVVGYFVVRSQETARLAHRVVPVVGALVTVWVIAGASTLAKVVGLVWLVAGAVVMGIGRARR